MIGKILWLVILMGAVPFILGLPWIRVIHPKHGYAFAYSTGFFVALALYQIACLPVIMSLGQFSTIVLVYSILLAVGCGASLWYTWRNHLLKKWTFPRLHWTEWIYLFAFLAILCVQVVRGFTYETTYMSYDDATYTTYSSDAYAGNGVLTVDAYTGNGTILSTKYALAVWNVYPAYFAAVSGVPVVTIAHTVQYIQLIILAYATCWFMAGEVLKRRDNQLIFMILIALFYWFGYHSHYSLTFRLLGPNYQGKAVLAVSLTPLILTVMIRKLEENYAVSTGVYFLILSIAGSSLTLWGSGTFFVIILGPLVLSLFRKERRWKHLLYAPWGCIVPVLAFGYYLLNKFVI